MLFFNLERTVTPMDLVRYGIISKVEPTKGFFFITEDATRASVFAHVKELPGLFNGDRRRVDLTKLVSIGQRVEFAAIETDRGLRATEVVLR